MANHGYGNFDTEVTNEQVLELLGKCNSEYFNDMLKIEVDFDGDCDYFTLWAGEIRVFEAWLSDPKTLECRHGHCNDVSWWIDGFICSYVVDSVGGNITDDGHCDVLDPDFYQRFPNYKDWLQKRYAFLPRPARWMKLRLVTEFDKQDFSKEFLNTIKGRVK